MITTWCKETTCQQVTICSFKSLLLKINFQFLLYYLTSKIFPAGHHYGQCNAVQPAKHETDKVSWKFYFVIKILYDIFFALTFCNFYKLIILVVYKYNFYFCSKLTSQQKKNWVCHHLTVIILRQESEFCLIKFLVVIF